MAAVFAADDFATSDGLAAPLDAATGVVAVFVVAVGVAACFGAPDDACFGCEVVEAVGGGFCSFWVGFDCDWAAGVAAVVLEEFRGDLLAGAADTAGNSGVAASGAALSVCVTLGGG